MIAISSFRKNEDYATQVAELFKSRDNSKIGITVFEIDLGSERAAIVSDSTEVAAKGFQSNRSILHNEMAEPGSELIDQYRLWSVFLLNQ